jgi:hypothetical protein
MASPKTLDPEYAISCNEPECRRPAVYSAEVCRLHLADVLRREGEDISFPPEWDGVWAAVVHLVRVALQEIPKEALDGDGPRTDIYVHALIDGTIDRQFAHRVTDMLATHLSDIFGAMNLQPAVEFEGDTLVVFRVAVPARAAELIAPCLRAAMRDLMVEMFGARSLRTAGPGPRNPRSSSCQPKMSRRVSTPSSRGRDCGRRDHRRFFPLQRSSCGRGLSRPRRMILRSNATYRIPRWWETDGRSGLVAW